MRLFFSGQDGVDDVGDGFCGDGGGEGCFEGEVDEAGGDGDVF